MRYLRVLLLAMIGLIPAAATGGAAHSIPASPAVLPASHDARAVRIETPARINLIDGATSGRVTVTVANDGDHPEVIGVYLDVVPPGGGDCGPAGRLLQTTVVLDAGKLAHLPTTLLFSCADPAAADGSTYTWFLAADAHADDLLACGPGAIQTLACFGALADDDSDPADNRRSRTFPAVIAP